MDKDGNVQIAGVSDKQAPIPIIWKKPVHVELAFPGSDGSGDMRKNPEVDLSLPPVDIQYSKSYNEAPPEVKRLLSLEFHRNKEIIEKITHDIVMKVQEHKHDFSSVPVTIAQMTVKIRELQRRMIRPDGLPNKRLKHVTHLMVFRRKTLLDYLRSTDYKKFEWLLETLDLIYKPKVSEDEAIYRPTHMERLTDLWCDELKDYRKELYKKQLESEQVQFLMDKLDSLRWIMKEEKELGLGCTVSEQDIAKAEEDLRALQDKVSGEPKGKEYLIFKPGREIEVFKKVPGYEAILREMKEMNE